MAHEERTEQEDRQQSQVYDAENELEAREGVYGITFKDLRHVRSYVVTMLSQTSFRTDYAYSGDIHVEDGGKAVRGWAGSRGGEAIGHFIVLPEHVRYERYLLHEVAHCVTPYGCVPHGPEFARNYLDLVHDFMPWEDAARLARVFRRHDVEIAPFKPERSIREFSDDWTFGDPLDTSIREHFDF